ncbi:hypothetical protein [Liquorilactobacillus vini]|uniref:hypothetical protein n=1 Tax=Liquorilactobacillus vini TaxID=238015 RepID=UPI0011475B02|nr:hypothetical protein [Liquorilactobacillus vini]
MTKGKKAGKSAMAYFNALVKTGKVKVQKVMANAQGTRMKSRVLSSGTALDPLRMKEQSRKASDILMLNAMTTWHKYKRDYNESLDFYFITFTVANINKGALVKRGKILRRLGGELMHDIQRSRFSDLDMVGAYGSWELTCGDPDTLEARLAQHDGRNLYHLHLHMLFAVDPDSAPDEDALYSAWADKVNIAGFATNKAAFKLDTVRISENASTKDMKSELSELTKYVAKPDAFYKLQADDAWHVEVFDEMYNFLLGMKRHPSYGLMRDINSVYNRYSKLVNALLNGFYTQSDNNFLCDFLTEFNNLEFDANQNKVLITEKKVMTNAEIAYYNRNSLKNIITDLTPESFDPAQSRSLAHQILERLKQEFDDNMQELIADSNLDDVTKRDICATIFNKSSKLRSKLYFDFDILKLAFETFKPSHTLDELMQDAQARLDSNGISIEEKINIRRVLNTINYYRDPKHLYDFRDDLHEIAQKELILKQDYYLNVGDLNSAEGIERLLDWRLKAFYSSQAYTFDEYITLSVDDALCYSRAAAREFDAMITNVIEHQTGVDLKKKVS